MQAEETKKRMDPKEYNKYLKVINLSDVYLGDLKSKVYAKGLSGTGRYSLSEDYKTIDHDEESVTIRVEYTLDAKIGKRKALTMSAHYVASFCTTERVPPEFIELYSQLSLPVQTFPFFRELANTMFSRMGFPPLLLPLRKYLVDDRV